MVTFGKTLAIFPTSGHTAVTLHNPHVGHQCDQMARLFAQLLAIYKEGNSPKISNNQEEIAVRLKIFAKMAKFR